ncbi:MAG: zinc ribbon domain-containing protein [Eubacterium sp.]|nr:zinc ribbon domain-containing protein [Eubacterium sp.]
MNILSDEKDKSAFAWECTSCGKTNKISDCFCLNCGAKNESKWLCRNCGQVNDSEDSFCIACGGKQEMYSDETDKSHTFSKKNALLIAAIVCIVISAIICVFTQGGLLDYINNGTKNDDIKTFDMGVVGNKITVDGTVAYVAGEYKILVPYDFYGTFSECESTASSKSLKGCVGPRLSSGETDALPEEVAREIIAFYGDAGGFWTAQAFIGVDGCHYAGQLGGIFKVDSDGVAHSEWGYCLDGADDETTMGLLVLYDIIVDDFEFIDVEDTADPNYSTAFPYDLVMASDESDEEDVADEYEFTDDNDIDNETSSCLPLGKYTLSHVFSHYSGWVKVVDSNGQYNDDWKSEEINRLKSILSGVDPEYADLEIDALEETLEPIQLNMYIDVSDEWMKCYNIHSDFDLCKPVMDEAKLYEVSVALYGHRINYSEVDDSMGNFYSFKGEVYKTDEDELTYSVGYGHNFYYYPDVNGIGVDSGNYELLFTLQ